MGRSREAATRTGPLNILAYRSAMMDKIISEHPSTRTKVSVYTGSLSPLATNRTIDVQSNLDRLIPRNRDIATR